MHCTRIDQFRVVDGEKNSTTKVCKKNLNKNKKITKQLNKKTLAQKTKIIIYTPIISPYFTF